MTRSVLMIFVSAPKKKVLVGRSSFSRKKFRRVLDAFGGAGIIIEYVPREDDPIKMPDWVMNYSLIPTGYTNRAPDVSSFSVEE